VTSYPTVEDAIAAHSRLIAIYGGSLGIRDLGALESALARPQTGYYHDLIQEAAALWKAFHKTIRSWMGTSGSL
jgi:death-on-curing protein